jgi:hypothetical protein
MTMVYTKRISLFATILISIFGNGSLKAHEGHAHTLTPEQEEAFYEQAYQKGDFEILNFRFEQTHWRECTDQVTGNYSNYNCANRRGISVILKDFMETHMEGCVQEGLDLVGGGQLEKLHIIHDGILGDRRHSPRSMHAENRAIDIRAFRVTNNEGFTKTYTYKGTENRAFYTAFRSCWGNTIKTFNNCPTYRGEIGRTGTIGWEDANHRNHMHTSVPYCPNGRYDSYFFNR